MVLATQEPDGGGVLTGGVRLHEISLAPNHDVGQQAPVFGVAVGDEGDVRVLQDVADPLETCRRNVLRLFVEGMYTAPGVYAKQTGTAWGFPSPSAVASLATR